MAHRHTWDRDRHADYTFIDQIIRTVFELYHCDIICDFWYSRGILYSSLEQEMYQNGRKSESVRWNYVGVIHRLVDSRDRITYEKERSNKGGYDGCGTCGKRKVQRSWTKGDKNGTVQEKMILHNIHTLLMFLAYVMRRAGTFTIEEKCKMLEFLGHMAANPDRGFALEHISEQPGRLRYTQ